MFPLRKKYLKDKERQSQFDTQLWKIIIMLAVVVVTEVQVVVVLVVVAVTAKNILLVPLYGALEHYH